MSDIFTQVSLLVLIVSLYWAMYFLVRPKIDRGKRYYRLFLLNLMFGIGMVIPYQIIFFRRIKAANAIFYLDTMIMGFAFLFHHLSVIIPRKRWKGLISPKMHGSISHWLFFVPFGLNILLGSYFLLTETRSASDFTVLVVFLVLGLITSYLGVKKGFELRKILG